MNNHIKKPINGMSKARGSWDWKPDKDRDIPSIKFAPKSSKGLSKKRRKRKKIKYVSRGDNQDFYTSKEWRQLRVRVIQKYDCKCMMCGRSPKEHGIVIHVDHIKPRAKNPELSLCFDNLQVLCDDCNIGKGARYDTDWRPDESKLIDEELDRIALLSSPLSDNYI